MLATGEQADPANTGRVTTHIRAAVLRRLRELYDGPAAYQAIAERFNTTTKAFAQASDTADLEANPGS